MNQPPEVLSRKLCFLIHRAFCEIRNLSRLSGQPQIGDLADTFEILPGLLADWKDENLSVIESVLVSYQNRYQQTTFDYLAILKMDDSEFMTNIAHW
jgi:hypothetical protein